MPGLILPQRWTQQPQYPVGFNADFPRPSFCYLPSAGVVDLANPGRFGSPGSSDTQRSPASIGVAYKTADATNAGLDFGITQAITSETPTILVVAKASSSAGVCTLFSQRFGSAPFSQFDFTLNADASLASSPGNIGFTAYNGNANSFNTTAGTFVDNNWHKYTVVRSVPGGSPGTTIYFDGRNTGVLTQAGTEAGSMLNASQRVRIGNIGDYTADAAFVGVCEIALVLVWSQPLTETLVRTLSQNPWQIFRPQTRRIFFDLGGGVGTQTLTPSLFTNNQSFFAPIVSAGEVTLSPSLVTNTSVFYAATLESTVVVTPNLYSNTQTFFSPLVTQDGAQVIAPDLFTNNQTFYSATVTTEVTLTPSLYTNTNTFYSATVAQAVDQTLTPNLFTNTQTFYSATVFDGTTTLTQADINAIASAVWSHPKALTIGRFLGLK